MDGEMIRERILEKIEDLKSKIESNEEFPEGEQQDVSFLVEMGDRLDECLSAWYF